MIKKEKGVSIGRLTPQIRQCGQPEWLVCIMWLTKTSRVDAPSGSLHHAANRYPGVDLSGRKLGMSEECRHSLG